MKIGIDIRNIGRKRTGDETVFLQLVKNLALLDRENEYFLFLDKRTPEELTEAAERLGVKGCANFQFIQLPAKNKFDWNLFVLPRALRRFGIDIYHTQYIVPFFLPRRLKVVTHVHDVSFRVYPEYIHWKDRLFLALLMPYSLWRADRVVAVSEFTRAEIVRFYRLPPEKVVVIPNALGEEFLQDEAGANPEAVRRKYCLPEKFFLYVGTLQPRKNIPSLVRAYAEARKQLPDTVLVLGGNRAGHNFDTRIDEVIRELSLEGAVLFPGYIAQADLPALMRAAQVFVFPSLYEGFGIPILEAMSQQVPVVVSDIPSLREVGGEAAAFVDTASLDSFSKTLYNVFIDSELRERMIAQGLTRVQCFSWFDGARELLELYKSLKEASR
jgi:glycosyltransferase involved in cell wall biosynthesis